MSYDPFRNYDSWLESPIQRFYEEQEAQQEAWEEFCESRNGPEDAVVLTINGPVPAPPRVPVVPVEASEVGHPDHGIYMAWSAMEAAVQARWDRLVADAEQHYDAPQFDEY